MRRRHTHAACQTKLITIDPCGWAPGRRPVASTVVTTRCTRRARRGRVLTDEDIEHYQKIVVAFSETIRIMAEIDAVIDVHGGWPDAFVTTQPGEGTT